MKEYKKKGRRLLDFSVTGGTPHPSHGSQGAGPGPGGGRREKEG